MEPCASKNCGNLVPAKQKCWECGQRYCGEHLTIHPRCQKFKLCPKRECWASHGPWCEKNLPYLGPLKIGKTIGNGPESVYVWYAKADFDLAKRQGKRNWPCKIGCTKGNPTARIIAQGPFTAFHSEPIIPLVIRARDSRTLEILIRATLEYAGRRIKNTRGTEWFYTNPHEIDALYRALGRITKSMA